MRETINTAQGVAACEILSPVAAGQAALPYDAAGQAALPHDAARQAALSHEQLFTAGASASAAPTTAADTAPRTLRLSDFDFALPPDLIAQHPAAERSASRLLDGTGPRPRTASSATCPAC